jgi:hypothetical protein
LYPGSAATAELRGHLQATPQHERKIISERVVTPKKKVNVLIPKEVNTTPSVPK